MATPLIDNIIRAESGGNPTARNPNSSAAGPGQFIDSTWLAMLAKHRPDIQGSPQELLALKNDPTLARDMTAAYAADNAGILSGAGLPVTPGTQYLAHFAGPKGAVGLLTADPTTPVASILGQKAVTANPFLTGKTVGDMLSWADRKMGATPTASAPAAGTPPLSLAGARPESSRQGGLQWAWDNATPGGPLWMARTLARGAAAIGGGATGQYDVQPEKPGSVSDADLSRLDATNAELQKRVFDFATLATPRPLPSVAARPLPLPPLPLGAKVTGMGVNGPIIEGLQGRPKDAFGWLNDARTGDAKGVLNHPELPGRPIDVIYGNEERGLRHIVGKHRGDIDKLPDRWDALKLTSEDATRARLKSDKAVAVVAKDFEGDPKNWLVSFFDPRGRLADRNSSGAVPPTYKGPVGPTPFLPVGGPTPWFPMLPPFGALAPQKQRRE